jgi:hypothetical protein
MCFVCVLLLVLYFNLGVLRVVCACAVLLCVCVCVCVRGAVRRRASLIICVWRCECKPTKTQVIIHSYKRGD